MPKLLFFKQRGAGYESVYYRVNNKRPTKSERGNRDLQNPQVWCDLAHIEGDTVFQKLQNLLRNF